MWPYNDDESLWLSPLAAERRLVPQDQISPELIAYHELRARELRSQALANAAGSLYNALRSPFQHKDGNGQHRWSVHWLRSTEPGR